MPCVVGDRLVSLLLRLAETWERSNRALLAFDGARFARCTEEELRICADIESLPLAEVLPAGSAALSRIAALLSERRLLLRSTRRTVCALWGVCAASQPIYDVAAVRTY